MIFVDEAGFYLLPMAVATWAPSGQTPVLHGPLTRAHLSAISGIPPDGRWCLQGRPDADDAKAGAVHSVMQVLNHPRLNHSMEVKGGVLAGRSAELLQAFFRERRSKDNR